MSFIRIMTFIDTTVTELVPFMLKFFKKKKQKLVTLAECLGQRPYLSKFPLPNITNVCLGPPPFSVAFIERVSSCVTLVHRHQLEF
jgi:hypothetical protein